MQNFLQTLAGNLQADGNGGGLQSTGTLIRAAAWWPASGASIDMRFAITALDRYLGVFHAFLNHGWEPVKLFTVPTDGRMFSNQEVMALARARNIEIQLSRLGERDFQHLQQLGCEVLIVASYQWRIGDWRPYLQHAVNFHPSLLPEFRGPYPLVSGILQHRPQWGVTCHKLEHELDAGDVLAQRRFDVSPDEDHESLDLKTQMAAKVLAAQVAGNFRALWGDAQPQRGGFYAPLWTDAERTLDFNAGVAAILRRVRAFGRFECLAQINEFLVYVGRAAGWHESHGHAPGTVVHTHALATVVACRDGFIAVLEWHLFAPEMLVGTSARR